MVGSAPHFFIKVVFQRGAGTSIGLGYLILLEYCVPWPFGATLKIQERLTIADDLGLVWGFLKPTRRGCMGRLELVFSVWFGLFHFCEALFINTILPTKASSYLCTVLTGEKGERKRRSEMKTLKN